MLIESITVVVDQPMDWVGSIAVPTAAILLSSGIALLLANWERQAAKRDRQIAEVANVMRSLTAVSSAEIDGRTEPELEAILTDLVSALNVLEMHLEDREKPLCDFIALTIFEAYGETTTPVTRAAGWCMFVLSGWQRGAIKGADLAAALGDAGKSMRPDVDVRLWRSAGALGPAPTPKKK